MILEPDYKRKYYDTMQCLLTLRLMLKQYALPKEDCWFQQFNTTQDMAKFFLNMIGTMIPEEMK